MTALRRQILSSQVFELIRQRVTSLEIPPGSRIDIPSLSTELEVSAIPIREALKRLVERGLILSTTGVGYHVVQITEATVHDVFALRRLLEGDAVLRLKVELYKEQLVQARDNNMRLLSAPSDLTRLRRLFDKVDEELHTGIIISSSANKMLREFYGQMGDITIIITHLNDRIRQSLREHIRILDALLAYDSEETRQRLLAHLDNAEEACLPVPSSEEGWAERYKQINGLETQLVHQDISSYNAVGGGDKRG